MLMDSNPARALLNLLPAKESLKKINSSWSSLPSWGWFVSFFSLQKHQMEADNNDDYILRESPLPPILECQGYSFVQSFGFATKSSGSPLCHWRCFLRHGWRGTCIFASCHCFKEMKRPDSKRFPTYFGWLYCYPGYPESLKHFKNQHVQKMSQLEENLNFNTPWITFRW